jgi:hypothetical protein
MQLGLLKVDSCAQEANKSSQMRQYWAKVIKQRTMGSQLV